MKWFPKFILISATLAASACASKHHSASDVNTSNDKRSTVVSASNNSVCREDTSKKSRNDVYFCQVNMTLNSDEAKKALTSSVKVNYGSVSGATLISNKASNAVGKTPDETCQRAFLSAVKTFQATAERKNKSSVHLVSYFDKKTIGGREYECQIGTWNSRVVLQGSFH